LSKIAPNLPLKEAGEENKEKLENCSKEIGEVLKETQRIYQAKGEGYRLCEARTILLKADFYFEHYSFRNHYDVLRPYSEELHKAETIFRECGCFQHQVTCLKYISLIDFSGKRYSESKKNIHKAID